MMGNFSGESSGLPLSQYLWGNNMANNTFSSSVKELERPQGLRQNILTKYAMPSQVKIQVKNDNENGDME